MDDKIKLALEYYNTKTKQILDFVNKSDNLTTTQLIEYGEEMSILEYKITALEVALEN